MGKYTGKIRQTLQKSKLVRKNVIFKQKVVGKSVTLQPKVVRKNVIGLCIEL